MYWILWINARNLKYIKPYNEKKLIKLADSKLRTKFFLKELDIPFPYLFDILKSRKQLSKYDWSYLKWKDFVVKPNKGSKGKGILLCYIVSEDIINVNGKNILIDDFEKLVLDILDGKYSMTLGGDTAIIEEKVMPSKEFWHFCEFGLADIRIISFNLVPIMAMLRYPTKESGGKANIAQWWVGFGIDIATWEIISMYKGRTIYKNEFPKDYKDFKWKKIMYWDDMLLYSSQIQYFTNIWYLWLDWVITNDGPSLLEINARAGMEIQLVSWEALEKRLRKIKWLKVSSPAKWVEISKSIFSTWESNPTISKKILFLSQPWQIITEKTEIDVMVKIDMTRDKSVTNAKLLERLGDNYRLKIRDIFIYNLNLKAESNIENNVIILWKNQIEDFLIQPIDKGKKKLSIWNSDYYLSSEEEYLEELDSVLSNLWVKINISKILTPTNYMEELDNFITWHGHYNPKFEYKFPSNKAIWVISDSIKKVEDRYLSKEKTYKSEIIHLFREKFEEIKVKFLLAKAYKEQKFNDIEKYNKLMYGDMDEDIYNISREKTLLSSRDDNKELLGKRLSLQEVIRKIKLHLRAKNLKWIRIVVSHNMTARILVRRSIPIQILISWTDIFYEKEVDMIMAHEIDVHLERYIMGQKSGWKILQSGTGFYLADEEWLAIYNSFKYIPEGYEKNAMYERYFSIIEWGKYDFSRLTDIIRWLDPNRSLSKVFKLSLRVKKGILNTSFVSSWTVYMKDKVYLDGYLKIKNYMENPDKVVLKRMKMGKIKLEDTKYLK